MLLLLILSKSAKKSLNNNQYHAKHILYIIKKVYLRTSVKKYQKKSCLICTKILDLVITNCLQQL